MSFVPLTLSRCFYSSICSQPLFANGLQLHSSEIPPSWLGRISQKENLQGTPYSWIYVPKLQISGLWDGSPPSESKSSDTENSIREEYVLPFQFMKPFSDEEQNSIQSGCYILN